VELSNVSVRIEAGEDVTVRYLPARIERHSDGYEMDYCRPSCGSGPARRGTTSA
jgi:hypothetical protein